MTERGNGEQKLYKITFGEEKNEEYCTDGNTAFGCDSDKNSLVFIYMF